MAEVRLPDAVRDDAEQDHDHAHEADQVGRELRRGVFVPIAGMADNLEVGGDVRDSSDQQDRQPHVNEQGKASELCACAI
jgi:hypothetical protein